MLLKKIAATGLAAAIAATTLVGTAEARHRHHHGFPFAAGAFGFTAGVFIGSALTAPRYPYYYYDEPAYGYYYDEPGYYYQPAPRTYYRPPPDYYGGPCNSPTGTSKPAWAMC